MRHLIQKQQFVLELEPGMDAFLFQHAASRYYRERLMPLLERIFNELTGEDEVIQLDHITIDLGVIGASQLQNGEVDSSFYELIKTEVARAIEKAVTRHPAARTGMRESVLTRWWYYMEHGRLPWNADRLTSDDLRQVLELFSVDYPAISRLRKALGEDRVFLQRVVAQHDEWFLEKLAAVLVSSSQDGLGEAVMVTSRVYRLLEEKYRAVMGGVAAEACDRDVVVAFRQWAARMAGFVLAPGYEKKSILWQRVLIAAAERPGEFARKGGMEVLLEELPDNHVVLESILSELAEGSDAAAIGVLRKRRDMAARSGQGSRGKEAGPEGSVGEDGAEISKGAGAPRATGAEEAPLAGEDVYPEDAPGAREAEGSPEKREAGLRAADDEARDEGLAPSPVERAVSAEEVVFNRDEVDEGGLYLPNAGVILAHPFLSTFFHRTGYWDGGGFTSLEARQKAILLLHFLVTGERNPQEYLLVMPKVLCGYALEMPMPGGLELTEEECAEAMLLLENIVKRWEKLGSTSIAGLREGFLQRNGKLSNKEGRLQLQMESSAIDVLLDYLPWNLQLVKLPWLKDILYVDWR